MMKTATRLDVQAVRKRFLALSREVHGHPLSYLDSAATTLKPALVVDAVASYYRDETANIHRGVHFLSEQATVRYEAARQGIQRFLGAAEPEEIILTSGTTDSINLVAMGYARTHLGPGDELLITHLEHHSNIVPWQLLCQERGCQLRVTPINDAGEVEIEQFQQQLTSRTRLVAVTYVSNALGTVTPLGQIIELAHAQGVPVLVDAAQAVAHLPLNVMELDCDFLAFSGHKLFGPTGTGVLYGKRALLEEFRPVKGGGDMIRSVTFAKTEYAELPHRLEAGTPHIAGVIGLGAAIAFVEDIGRAELQAAEHELLEYATGQLQQIPGLKIIGTARRKAAAISFVVDGIHPHDLGTIVDQHGVAIRTGHHCAQPVMDRFGVPATARASFAVYNTPADIDQLVKAIGAAQELFA